MSGLSREERVSRLDQMIADGLVIRYEWTQGQERACLLAALSPEAGEAESASACPASVIPPWLAHLTPSLDDRVSDAYWPTMVRRYAATVRRAAMLTAEDWQRLDYAARAIALRVALPHAGTAASVVESVIALCDRAASGEVVSDDEWRAAEAAARAAEAAARAARAVWAAEAAARAAEAEAAAAAAWDAIAARVLDAIDATCAGREAS